MIGLWRQLRWLCSLGWNAVQNVVMSLWILKMIVIGLLVVALGFVSGCSRTVLVQSGSPVRIGPATQGRVYTLIEGEWVLSQNTVELPEGWYLVSPEFVEDK